MIAFTVMVEPALYAVPVPSAPVFQPIKVETVFDKPLPDATVMLEPAFAV
jgi:hypothetical protein